jgi:hypothetical protein
LLTTASEQFEEQKADMTRDEHARRVNSADLFAKALFENARAALGNGSKSHQLWLVASVIGKLDELEFL